jgi:hypothetical protein
MFGTKDALETEEQIALNLRRDDADSRLLEEFEDES